MYLDAVLDDSHLSIPHVCYGGFSPLVLSAKYELGERMVRYCCCCFCYQDKDYGISGEDRLDKYVPCVLPALVVCMCIVLKIISIIHVPGLNIPSVAIYSVAIPCPVW